ncbi:MAG TPA: hypothetical protein PKA95_05200 [Thermomicrobiales bacterium]|nr:hypothetical protein [Thermomicrobiales bacterium]
MALLWLAVGLTLVTLVSWVGSRVLRALFGPGRERSKSAEHNLGEAEQLTRNPKV